MAITIDTRGPNGRGRLADAAAAGIDDRARAFLQAQRHTRLVKLLRVGLPIGAAGVLLAYAATLVVSWKLGPGRLSVGAVEVTADDLTMKNPKYFGVTKDGGNFEVRAKKAIVEFNSQAPIRLIDVDGDLTQPNKVVTHLKAKHGLLDNAKNELELYDGIEIDSTNGLVARLSRATVYSKENRVVSRFPVTATTPTGSVKSQSMTMKTDARQTSFRGNVEVRLQPTGGQTAAGLGRDPRQPVDVRAQELDVDDLAKNAHFRGDVVAIQGETQLKAPDLHIEYEGKGATQLAGAQPAQPGEGSSRLKMLRARGGTVVTAGTDRRVTSERADFDALADTALFLENVTVTQGKNVLQGRRLFVNRKTGKNRLESPPTATQPAGRVAATFYQGDNRQGAAAKPKSRSDILQEGVLGSFRTDPNAPMNVEADTLDTDDAAKTATFRGNVKAQQGEFNVRTVEMVAHYTGQSGFGLAGSPKEDGQSGGGLTRVDANQKVLITSKDGQTATGDWAIFDVKANTVLLGGRVIVTRGKDIAEGPRLLIDLTTGLYRFELEQEAATAAPGPALSASPPSSGPSAPIDPATRSCPPGKQCLLFYPKEAKERAKEAVKKVLPPGSPLIPSDQGAGPFRQGN